MRGLGDGIDQRHEASGDGDRPEGVVTAPRRRQPALGHDAPSQRHHRGTDGDVQEEDVLPAGVTGEHASGQQADGGGPGADAAPDAEGFVALGALGEHVHDDGQRGGQHERRPEALDAPHDDQEGVTGGQGAGERGPGEHCRARHQKAPTAQEVSGPPAEQQEAAEGERVSGDHPLQVSFGEVELAADGGEGDVDDRQVDDRHDEGHGQQCERPPAPGRGQFVLPAGDGAERWRRSGWTGHAPRVGRGRLRAWLLPCSYCVLYCSGHVPSSLSDNGLSRCRHETHVEMGGGDHFVVPAGSVLPGAVEGAWHGR